MDSDAIAAFARAHGYRNVICPSCVVTGRDGCAGCDDTNRMWRTEDGSLMADSAIARAMESSPGSAARAPRRESVSDLRETIAAAGDRAAIDLGSIHRDPTRSLVRSSGVRPRHAPARSRPNGYAAKSATPSQAAIPRETPLLEDHRVPVPALVHRVRTEGGVRPGSADRGETSSSDASFARRSS